MPLDPQELRTRLANALSEHFVLGDLLGAGGSAAVFRARDRVLDREVAIKVIDPGLAESAELDALFLHEAQIVASLEHPNVVPVYSAHSGGGLLYLVMRLLDGKSLTKRLTGTALSPAESVRIAREVASALAAAHARGIVHRDIKPDNVLLDASGRAFVTDFGIAQVMSRAGAEANGVTSGTPGYMSPEQLLGEEVDGRTDVYATGVLLFEMLAGRPPFVTTTLAETLAKHITQTPPLLGALRPEVPSPLAAIAEQCLRKSAAERPTAEQLVGLLTAASTPDALRSPDAVRRAKRRRRFLVAGSLAALGFSVLALLLLAMVRLLMLVYGDGGEPALYAFYEGVPTSVIAQAQRAGALRPSERVLFAFRQEAADTNHVLLITDSTIIRRSTAGTLRIPLLGSEFDIRRQLKWFGPSIGVAVAVRSNGQTDTLLTNVSGTETMRLSSALAALDAARTRRTVP